MIDAPDEPESVEVPSTAQEKAEARAIRRRWVTLGEAVAVLAVVISGATLYNSWSMRRDAADARAQERASIRAATEAEKHHVRLVATDAGSSSLAFKGVDCALQATDITFPTALKAAPQFTVTVHEIQADWFAKPLLKMTDGGDDRREGRIPVLIESRCEGAGGTRRENAIYDIAYRIVPGFLSGRSVKLRGMVFREDASADAKARLDTLWAKP